MSIRIAVIGAGIMGEDHAALQMWEILCCRASLPSTSESAPSSKYRHTANPLWERACPRRRRISRHKC